jgi:hypothetical protein
MVVDGVRQLVDVLSCKCRRKNGGMHYRDQQ